MSTSARLILGLAMSLIAPAMNPGSPPSTVVIAESFTSEGCSSCPPADTLVRQLADAQPFDGAHLIALQEHVDYWDRLGRRDPFSSPSLAPLGELCDRDRAFAGTVDVPVAQNWNPRKLQIVGVIQQRDSRRIFGAGAAERSFRPGSDQ
jgi:hypothetical protein